MISFQVSSRDKSAIVAIASRAMPIFSRALGRDAPKVSDVIMDLTACHANGCPLRLQDLLEADDLNLVHDVVGIHRHIDHETGALGGSFLPRFHAT